MTTTHAPIDCPVLLDWFLDPSGFLFVRVRGDVSVAHADPQCDELFESEGTAWIDLQDDEPSNWPTSDSEAEARLGEVDTYELESWSEY